MIESSGMLRRRTFHRQQAHLVLSAMRHRAAELGARVDYRRGDAFRAALAEADDPLDVVQPTTYAAARLVADLTAERPLQRHPARGHASSRSEFVGWASRREPYELVMEDFYAEVRTRLGLLVQAGRPVGGRWIIDTDHRGPPPRIASLSSPGPGRPREDEIDAEVRSDLDALAADGVRFRGEDGPRRYAATRAEALATLADFVEHRLPSLGCREPVWQLDPNAVPGVLAAPLYLGLLHPVEVARAAENAYAAGAAPLAATEGLIRQVIGWRDFDWHLYWFLGPEDRPRRTELEFPPVVGRLWRGLS